MENLDLSFIITATIATISLLSPILTSIINNMYHIKMKKMDIKLESYKNNELHKREIFEDFCKKVGNFSASSSYENMNSLGAATLLLSLHIDSDSDAYSLTIEILNNLRLSQQKDQITKSFSEPVDKLLVLLNKQMNKL